MHGRCTTSMSKSSLTAVAFTHHLPNDRAARVIREQHGNPSVELPRGEPARRRTRIIGAGGLINGKINGHTNGLPRLVDGNGLLHYPRKLSMAKAYCIA